MLELSWDDLRAICTYVATALGAASVALWGVLMGRLRRTETRLEALEKERVKPEDIAAVRRDLKEMLRDVEALFRVTYAIAVKLEIPTGPLEK